MSLMDVGVGSGSYSYRSLSSHWVEIVELVWFFGSVIFASVVH